MSVKTRLESSDRRGAVPHTKQVGVGKQHGGVSIAFLPGDATALPLGDEFDQVLSAYFSDMPEGRTFTCQMLRHGEAVFIINGDEDGTVTISLPGGVCIRLPAR